MHVIDAVGAKVILLMDRRVTLVDTGGPGSAGRILAYLVGIGRRPADVERIVLTHAHVDHAGSLAELREATGARVCVHESEAGSVAGHDARSTIPRHAWLGQMLRPVLRRPAVPVDERLADGHVLPSLGGTEVLHVPGHSRGSIALYVRSRRALIAGDALEVRRGRLAPPSRLFSEDMSRALDSIDRLADLEFDLLILSHYRARRGRIRRELYDLTGRDLRASA